MASKIVLALFVGLLVATLPGHAYAQGINPGVLDTLILNALAQAAQWQNTLQQIALGIFGGLLIIEFAWTMGRALINGIELGPTLGLIVQQAVAAGFFYWLIINPMYLYDVVHGFWQAGEMASGTGVVTASDVVSAGFAVAKAVFSGLTFGSIFSAPVLAVLLILVGIIVIFLFGLMAATLVETLIEAAIVSYAGIVLLGLGGLSYTRDYAIGMYRWALAVGVKLLVLQLIMGFGTNVIKAFAAQVAAIDAGSMRWQDAAVMLIFPVVMWRLVERVPGMAQGMVAGSHVQYFGGLYSAASAMAAAGTAAAGSITAAGAAIHAAGRLASAQTAASAAGSSGGGGIGGSISQAAMITGRAAANVAGAAANDIASRAAGTPGASLGRFAGRMASRMNRQANQVRAATEASAPPQSNQGSNNGGQSS